MPFNPYMFNPRAFDQDFGQVASNPFAQMRQKSIFKPPTTPDDDTKRFLSQVNPPPQPDFSQPPPDAAPEQTDAGKYYDDMMKLRKPGPAVTAYQAALKDQPTDDNTNVSMPRKIMGTLAGIAGGFAKGPAAGAAAANDIIDSPYKTAMRDYTTKMKALQESANLERDDNKYQSDAIKTAREFGLKHDEFAHKLDEDRFERGIKERTTTSGETTAQAAVRRAATGEKTAGDQGRNIDSEIANRAGMLGVARQNAGSTARAAATGEKNANTNETNVNSEVEYRKNQSAARSRELDIRDKAGKLVSPTQQAAGVSNALRDLYTDKRFRSFIEADPEKGTFNMGEDDGTEMYREFKRRVKVLAEASIKSGTPFSNSLDDFPSVTVGKPR